MWFEEGRHADKFDAAYHLWIDGQTERWDQIREDSSGIDVSDYVTFNDEICPYVSSLTVANFK